MPVIEYYADGKLHRLTAQPPARLVATAKPKGKGAKPVATAVVSKVVKAVHAQADRLGELFHTVAEAQLLVAVPKPDVSAVVPTPTLIVEGAPKAELKRLKDEFGVEVVDEGLEGKVLLRAPEGGVAGVKTAADAARKAYERGHVQAAHPNFVRVMQQIKPSAAGGQPLWNHNNEGSPGVPGADVAAAAAWTITKGKGEVRVAILDEGVDVTHPALKPALVAQKDFVDDHPTAQPDGNDAHGTACAGIILSRDTNYPGLAPACSLVAIRIAKGDGNDGWVFDDFKTADAIDWAWRDGKADVLSNSWGGGPPVDAITRAFGRARTKGRSNKGAVVVIAAGNSNRAIQYPGTLPDVLTIGASTPWDERKSPTSKDGENWWGSCYGADLDLLAPGVKIATTDIQGASGYSNDNFVLLFNGTSSATPHVAGAAALILSVMSSLNEKKVRDVLTASADRLTTNGKWDKYVGWGRLNVFAALRLARR